MRSKILISGRVFTVQIQPLIGELIRGVSMPESLFDQEKNKLKGMNEVDATFELPSALSDEAGIKKKVYETANVVQVPSVLESGDLTIKFAGRTTATSSYVLLTLVKQGTEAKVSVNCDKIVTRGVDLGMLQGPHQSEEIKLSSRIILLQLCEPCAGHLYN